MTQGPSRAPILLVLVVGPTAVGKSEVAGHLARRFHGWILSVDSMAVYRELDIGTSKPTPAMRREIPHRGLDLVDPDQDFSMGDFLRAAEEALEEMRAAGVLPILVGGTGLYLRGVLKGVAPLPKRDAAFREKLLQREVTEGSGTLHRLLQEVDPASARRIAPRDTQRLVRALELSREGYLDTLGRAGPEWQRPDRFPAVKVGLNRQRRELECRVRARVEAFFARGLREETEQLLARYPSSGNAFKALGYREVAGHLRGEQDLEATKELIVRNTLRYAKRQMTWFRKEPGVRWFELSGQAEAAAPRIGDYVAAGLQQRAALPK